jgi:uncharacterized membrane protein
VNDERNIELMMRGLAILTVVIVVCLVVFAPRLLPYFIAGMLISYLMGRRAA